MSQNKEPSKTLIYVSNLPFDTTDEQFRDLFKGFTVKTAYVAKRKNGRSKGFGFVNLEKESDQNAAIEKLNGLELSSRKLIARIAYNDDRRNENGELKEEFRTATTNTQQPPSETVVYVSNLAWTVNDEELRKIFAEFNPKTVTVATRNNGRSKGFGFVEFNSKEDREKALSLDQKTFSERQIGVKPSTGFRGDKPRDTNRNNNNRRSKSPRRNRDNNNNRRNNNNNRRSKSPSKRTPSGNTTSSSNSRSERKTSDFTIYIKNLPFELDETDLKDVFGEFHPTAANIPKRDGRSKGFGFVEFGNAKDRDDSLRALDQSEINGRVVSISVSRGGASSNNNNRDNNNRRNRSPRRNRDNNNNNRSGSKNRPRSEKKSTATGEQSKTNVYVSNIPFSINEKRLEEVFTGLKINNCTIPRKRNGNSFGYAFIEFASTEDQQKALKLNETEVEGRKLTIQAAHQRTESK